MIVPYQSQDWIKNPFPLNLKTSSLMIFANKINFNKPKTVWTKQSAKKQFISKSSCLNLQKHAPAFYKENNRFPWKIRLFHNLELIPFSNCPFQHSKYRFDENTASKGAILADWKRIVSGMDAKSSSFCRFSPFSRFLLITLYDLAYSCLKPLFRV